MKNYTPKHSIDIHLNGSLPELVILFKNLNKDVLAISNEIYEPYATGASICYKLGNGTRFLELQVQKKQLKLFCAINTVNL